MDSTLEDVEVEIENLNPNKASTFNGIPTRNLMQNSDICSLVLHNIINNAIRECNFPDKLQLADLSPLHKADDKTTYLQ